MLPFLLFALIKLVLVSSNETKLPLLEIQSNEIKDQNNPSNSIPLKPFSNTREIYDPMVINLISKAFHKHKLLIPKDISQRIVDYVPTHDKTIDEFHNRIKSKLKEVTGKQKILLNPLGLGFVSNLLRLITNNKGKIPEFHPFWYDLKRLLFKYTLSMRMRFADNDQLFEKSVENIKNVMIVIDTKIGLFSRNINLDLMTTFDFFIFFDLIEYEIFDYPQLLELFANDIIDKEANLKMTFDQIEKVYCNNGFNNNPLLKMMLIRFASDFSVRNQLTEREWITNKNVYSQRNYAFAIDLHHIYSNKVEERESKIKNIESMWPSYLSQSTIKFFIDNNLQFRIVDSSDLVQFLKRLEYIEGLLKGTLIVNIIKFKNEENKETYKWNKDIFSRYLMEEMEENRISREEYNKYIKLID